MNDHHTPRCIIFVPGKNPKPPAEVHKQALWRCLVRGAEQAGPVCTRGLSQAADDFILVSWNHEYYGCDKPGALDSYWIDSVIRRTQATEEEKREALSLNIKITSWFYSLADRYPWFIDIIPDAAVKSSVQETIRYFEDIDGIGSRIRAMLKKSLRQALDEGREVLLVSHSMGCVIAYDSLWELWHEEGYTKRIDHFITLGSPLGMHFVQQRIKGCQRSAPHCYPGNIRKWSNVAAEGDLVALDKTVFDDFGDMKALGLTDAIHDYCHNVFNYFRNESGLNVHRSYGYLVNVVVGRIVCDWWENV